MNFGYFIKSFLIFPVGSRKRVGYDDYSCCMDAGTRIKILSIISFLYKYRLYKISLLISGAVFTLAFVGKIDTTWFGYKSILGILFIFMTGCILGSKEFLKDKKG